MAADFAALRGPQGQPGSARRVAVRRARTLAAERPEDLPEAPACRADLVALTRLAIGSLMPYQRASLSCAARCMGLRKGVLKAALGRRDVSFTELRDGIRFEQAIAHLAGNDLPLAEIGMLLGFSEESSFFRAFKRWSGETPGAYRRRAQGFGQTSA